MHSSTALWGRLVQYSDFNKHWFTMANMPPCFQQIQTICSQNSDPSGGQTLVAQKRCKIENCILHQESETQLYLLLESYFVTSVYLVTLLLCYFATLLLCYFCLLGYFVTLLLCYFATLLLLFTWLLCYFVTSAPAVWDPIVPPPGKFYRSLCPDKCSKGLLQRQIHSRLLCLSQDLFNWRIDQDLSW